MSENIKLLEDSATAVTIWNAICDSTPSQDIIERYKLKNEADATEATVVLLVNGVEVPVRQTLEDYWKHFEDQVNQAAVEKVKALIKGTPLEALAETMRQFEWELKSKLAPVLEAHGIDSSTLFQD